MTDLSSWKTITLRSGVARVERLGEGTFRARSFMLR